MRERPILFSAPMVRAILDGSKTQTRRVVKPQPDFVADAMPARFTPRDEALGRLGELIRCPYGQPGDRLWVRETHSIGPRAGVPLLLGEESGSLRWPNVTYEADGAVEQRDVKWRGTFGRKRPSIHMPRWASRITLEVTGVRVERLHDISDSDAIAEGIERHDGEPTLWKRGPLSTDQNNVDWTGFPRLAYRSIWEAINGADSWAANPWVWVVEFNRVTP